MTSRREIALAGEKIWFCGMTGQVAGDKKWSETRVQSHGVLGQSGHTVINTQVNTRHEFWLVAADGEEQLIEFFNSQVSVRGRQFVTAIWGAGIHMKTGPFLMLRNNNAQSSTWLISDPKTLLKRMGLSDPMLKILLIGLGAAAFSWLLLHIWLCTLLIAVAGAVVGREKRNAKARTVKKAVTEAMDLELQSLGLNQRVPPGERQSITGSSETRPLT